MLRTKLPDFIVVGAAKSATSTIFSSLIQHPELFIPDIKECRFFSQMPMDMKGGPAAEFQNKGPRDIVEYMRIYKDYQHKIKGDMSNDYFYFYEESIKNIKTIYKSENQPLPKIIIILRRPDDRVFSMYHHSLRLGSEWLDFKQAFSQSQIREDSGYAWVFNLKKVGLSFKPVQRYLQSFSDVKIFLTEDISSGMISELSLYLGVPKPKSISVGRKNQNTYSVLRSPIAGSFFIKISWQIYKGVKIILPRSTIKLLKKIFNFINNLNKNGVKDISIEDRKMLAQYYSQDIKKLQQIIDKDLQGWVKF